MASLAGANDAMICPPAKKSGVPRGEEMSPLTIHHVRESENALTLSDEKGTSDCGSDDEEDEKDGEEDNDIELEIFLEGLQNDSTHYREEGGARPHATSGAAPMLAASSLARLSHCEMCQAARARYRCPGCLVQSCSLECSRRHKQESGCTGQRSAPGFVPLELFDERTLQRDYGFLESLQRQTERIQAHSREVQQHLSSGLTGWQRALLAEAARREIRLRFLPASFQRHRLNHSRWDRASASISWTLEFLHPPYLCLRLDAALDTRILLELLQDAISHTTPVLPATMPHLPTKSFSAPNSLTPLESADNSGSDSISSASLALKELQRIGLDKLVFLLQYVPSPANQPMYYRLDPQISLASALRGHTIIEYPQILVILPTELPAYPLATINIQACNHYSSSCLSSRGTKRHNTMQRYSRYSKVPAKTSSFSSESTPRAVT